MILCGIDSSTTYTAISYFRDGQYEKYELIDLHKEKDPEKRSQDMILAIYEVLDRWKPDIIYQEYTWMARNPKTAITLTGIVGAVWGWALLHDCKWSTIHPSVWRANLGLNEYGKKRSDLKQSAKEFIKTKYGIDVPRDDVSDAICIGIVGIKQQLTILKETKE